MKKTKLVLILIFILGLLAILSNKAYAINTKKLDIAEFNITDIRPYTSKKYSVTTPNGNIHTIFKIIKNNGTSYVHEDALYCSRSGLGFGNTEQAVSLNDVTDVTYTEKYNLKTDATSVMNYYINAIGYNISNNDYNAILWIIDNMYLPEHKDNVEMKEKLMKKANIINSELTDDDIEFIQQMALWYFTNYDENGEQNSLSLADTYVLSNTTKIDGESLTETKARQVDTLYRYFIDNAKTHATEYGVGDSRELLPIKPEINVNSASKTVSTSNGYKVIGPFSISETAGNVDYDLTIKVSDKDGKIIPEKQDETPIIYVVKNPTDMTTDISSIKDAIGQGEFYIKISKLFETEFNLEDVNIEAKCEYGKMYKTTATLWLAEADEQPVVKIDKEEILEGNFKLNINKVDKDGKLIPGAEFTIITEDRQVITLTNNGDGTFSTDNIDITEEGQEFIYEIQEIVVPSGYIGMNGTFKIKITTKKSEDGTKYVLDEIKFLDNDNIEQASISGITFEITDDTVTLKIENEKVKAFDLSLRKFITKVNGRIIDDRIPEIDTSKLNTIDKTTGKIIETATYTHKKEPVAVTTGDVVTYTIRIYNEGDIDAYATEIADYIPEGLGYLLNYKTNTDNFWTPVVDSTTITMDLVGTEGLYETENEIKNLEVTDFYSTDSLSDVKILVGKSKVCSTAIEDEKIKAYNPETTSQDIDETDKWQKSSNGTDGLYYRDVEITCIVLAENTVKDTIKNIAEIEEHTAVDENGDKITDSIYNTDRDSTPSNVDTNNYVPPIDNSTYQEDDDDYENLIMGYFDLALRKFITALNEEEITSRIPEPKANEEGNIEYVHDKEPVYVANGDIITYTIRVYNEGTVLGYAMEVSDDIPDGLVFLPEHQINKEYKWEMIDINGEKTSDPSKAVEIRTRYLENDLLQPYDATKEISDTNPDHAEVKVAFQIIEENITQDDRIIINRAQITEDKPVDEDGNELDIDDEDSIPNEWNEGEDDQDIEKVYVKKFDLALLKWVTQTIVTVDGKTTVTDTGFTPYDKPEPIAKVIIDKKKLNKTTVKFVYNIIIINEGEIEGYATEITDYIPEGLEFVAEDNPIWTKVDDNKITTRALEGTLLKPGETATIEVVFTWKRGANNLGLKTNIAEISEDYNNYGSEDIDSTPDNVKPDDYNEQQEDDDDKALVILELKTGGNASYIWLGLTVLLILAGGITLIKRYVI